MTQQVLAKSAWGAADGRDWARKTAMVALGVALLWISAKTRVAVEPVPVTMQTLVVMALALAYGARLGVATILAYLALGAAGVPVFAGTPEKGVGIAYMAGPTGGYLIGFVAAAWIAGKLAERGWDRNVFLSALAMAVGLVFLYVPGVLWLAYGFPLTAFSGLGIAQALEFGVFPFVLIDAAKLSLAALGFPLIWRLVGRRG